MNKKKFKCYNENYDDDGVEIEAYDHETAAEEFAEQDEDGDPYLIISENNFIDVFVVDENDVGKKFRVNAHFHVNYFAHEVDDEI